MAEAPAAHTLAHLQCQLKYSGLLHFRAPALPPSLLHLSHQPDPSVDLPLPIYLCLHLSLSHLAPGAPAKSSAEPETSSTSPLTWATWINSLEFHLSTSPRFIRSAYAWTWTDALLGYGFPAWTQLKYHPSQCPAQSSCLSTAFMPADSLWSVSNIPVIHPSQPPFPLSRKALCSSPGALLRRFVHLWPFILQCFLVFEQQPSSFPTDKACIENVMNLLRRRARQWATA